MFGTKPTYPQITKSIVYKLGIETTKKIDILTKQLVIQSKSLDDIKKLVKDKEKMLAAIPSIQPIKNNDLSRIASGFGMRTDPFDKSRKMHKGMDFSAPRNTPVYAASNGKIIRADSRSIGYGKHIRIDHGYGFVTLYAHLNYSILSTRANVQEYIVQRYKRDRSAKLRNAKIVSICF